MMPIRAVLFDLDQTLHDRSASLGEYLQRLYRRLRINVPYDSFHARFLELDRNGYADRAQLFAAIAQEFKTTDTQEEMLADFQHSAWRSARLFDGVTSLLRELRRGGYKLGVITNGSVATQRAKLQATRLEELVDVVLISEEEGIAKPDPRIFLRVAERLDLPPSDCLFVGDHPEQDIVGAAGAGMTTVWVTDESVWSYSERVRPSHIINTITELERLVPRIVNA